MKKLLKTLAVVLAFVLAVDAPAASVVSAAGTVAQGSSQVLGESPYDTSHGGEDTSHGGEDTSHGGEDTSHGGDDTTWDGEDQVLAVVIKGDKVLNIEMNDTVDLEANVIMNNGRPKDMDWTVEGDSVVISKEADNTCTLSAFAGGTAKVTFTATGKYGSKSDSVTVNVKEYVTEMHFAEENYNGYDTEKNTGDIRFCEKHTVDMSEELVKNPATATDTITYSVDNKKIAAVDAKGVVTFKKKGDVVLTAVSEKGVVARTAIHVTEGNPIKKIRIQQLVNGNGADIAKNKLTLDQYGADAKLVVSVEGKDKNKPVTDELTWTSAKPAFVELVGGVSNGKTQTLVTDWDESAEIQACGVGSSKITVKASGGKSASITVTAQAPTTKLMFVDEDGMEVKGGETYPLKKLTLQLARDPEVSKDKIVWTSSNKRVVAVSGKKNDTALATVKIKTVDPTKTEKVTITAQVKNSDVKAAYDLTIKPSEITGLKAADNMKLALSVGEKTRYSVEILGNGTPDEITWSSSNSKVLSIDKDGYATALKAGKATVKAVATDAKGKAGKATTVTYKVTVTQPTTALSMKKSLITVVAGNKKTVSFTAVQAPKGAKKEKITYSLVTNGTTVKDAAIDSNKGKVTVPATATAGQKIVVRAAVGNITTEGTILVIGKTKSKVVFENSAIKKNKLEVQTGDKVDLKPALDPLNNYDAITYTTSKKGIVAVDAKGMLYALQPGTVTVTAKTTSGAKTTLKVTVKNPDVQGTGTGDVGSGDKK